MYLINTESRLMPNFFRRSSHPSIISSDTLRTSHCAHSIWLFFLENSVCCSPYALHNCPLSHVDQSLSRQIIVLFVLFVRVNTAKEEKEKQHNKSGGFLGENPKRGQQKRVNQNQRKLKQSRTMRLSQ